jgi:uncharacterized cupin superfamily protein
VTKSSPWRSIRAAISCSGASSASPLANRQLGASWFELPPGALSYPSHWHGSNEEAIYVIAGEGLARIGGTEVPIRAGDWIAFPIGPAHAHQIENRGDSPLRYLCVATNHTCEVVGYPDSNKVLAMAGESMEDLWVRQLVRGGEGLDYWDGEPAA